MTEKRKQYILVLLLSVAALAVLLPLTFSLSGGVGSDSVSAGETAFVFFSLPPQAVEAARRQTDTRSATAVLIRKL